MSEYKKLTLNGADFPKYESPIQVLFDDDCPNPIITEFEDAIVAQASQILHIKIDKDELAKALAYDRGQYEKGYRDALAGLEQESENMSECMTQEDAERMDASQAAQILKPLRAMMLDQYGCPISDVYFALGKAIEALERSEDDAN